MREIKFRAWDGEKMLKHVYFHTTPYGWIWDANNCKVGVKDVMQFTGEIDANGYEIYEGDIVASQVYTEYGIDIIKEEVTFNAGAFYPICMQPSATFKIIGNIYEKP